MHRFSGVQLPVGSQSPLAFNSLCFPGACEVSLLCVHCALSKGPGAVAHYIALAYTHYTWVECQARSLWHALSIGSQGPG